MITDNTTENDLLAETIEELGQSLTELQQVINDIKEQVNYRPEEAAYGNVLQIRTTDYRLAQRT